jgi:hypothetical protein
MNIFNSHSKERLFCDQGVVSKRSKIIAEPNLVAQARLGAHECPIGLAKASLVRTRVVLAGTLGRSCGARPTE